MHKWIIYLVLFGLLSGGLFYIKHRMDEATRLEVENKSLKSQNKEIQDEAQSFADRPRTNDDIVDRLCAWGIYQLESEGGPKQQIPVFCRD